MNYSLTLEDAIGIKGLRIQIEPEVIPILKKTARFLQERQITAYLVGGFVRDILAGRPTIDLDVAIGSDALQTGAEMADVLGGRLVLLDEARRIARVVLLDSSKVDRKPWHIDLSTISGDILQDLGRRDFTIDAMALEFQSFQEYPGELKLIDPFNGRKDLEKRVIKAVSETVFQDDPVRLLRGVRLAAELDCKINAGTEALIRENSNLVQRVAGERVREELIKILGTPNAGRFVRHLDKLHLLTAIIPELELTRGVEQPKEHHWDVLNHSLETVVAVEFLLRQGAWPYFSAGVLDEVPWSEKLRLYFASEVGNADTHAAALKLAALLHDIAKPETKIIANERVRFLGHAEQGAALAAGILERLRFSNKEIKLVESMVRYHLRPTQMSHEGLPTRRAIYRYLRDTGDASIDILFLSLADHLAARGPDLDVAQWKWHVQQAQCILTDCFPSNNVVPPLKLIDGQDLMNIFGFQPGPEIREMLESVKEAQAVGDITSREEALSYVKNRLLYKEQKK